jgi:acyl-CoA thioester hydrolase
MQGFRHVIPITVRFRDIDAMGHVNNAVFFTYLETARVSYFRQVVLQADPHNFTEMGVILAEISCQFKAPIHYGQSVEVGTRIVEMRNSSLITQQRIEVNGQLAALSRGVVVHYDYQTGQSARIPREIRTRVAAFEGISEES